RYHLREKSLKTYGGIQYRYKQGDPIPVFFDPAKPELAVLNLECLRDWFVSITVLVGILMLAVSVFVKEGNDRSSIEALSDSYDGSAPLPSLNGTEDTGILLKLNTGMSLLWRMGIPFLAGCFIGITPLLLGTQEINPGWSIGKYGAICCAIWGGALILGLVFSAGFSYTLFVDGQKREIMEVRRVGFSKHVETMKFSQVAELRLYRELWRNTNPLKNWILFIQGGSGKSITISRGYRDFQVAHEDYLNAIKMRIEYLMKR
ncbi:MAG: hypothetical protein JEZ02_20085, partial [Desulfatibacillum sp.]|nr:hypothetical protein [Desulfatibacillum sp.]